MQFLIDFMNVLFDRSGGDAHFIRYFLVQQALGEPFQQFSLARGDGERCSGLEGGQPADQLQQAAGNARRHGRAAMVEFSKG